MISAATMLEPFITRLTLIFEKLRRMDVRGLRMGGLELTARIARKATCTGFESIAMSVGSIAMNVGWAKAAEVSPPDAAHVPPCPPPVP